MRGISQSQGNMKANAYNVYFFQVCLRNYSETEILLNNNQAKCSVKLFAQGQTEVCIYIIYVKLWKLLVNQNLQANPSAN